MKQKLTLTIDRDVVQQAKAQARREGCSLSSMIEGQLKNQCSGVRDASPEAIIKELTGVIQLEQPNTGDARYDHLVAKYLAR